MTLPLPVQGIAVVGPVQFYVEVHTQALKVSTQIMTTEGFHKVLCLAGVQEQVVFSHQSTKSVQTSLNSSSKC
ncbi:hypothetical protein EXN66_Car003263 [Channa argus]|uniref:Uncharacterized protein n=1 Tax=Channa argus TaxID=215402 RepID=A0A6G1PBC1_CHAAH|nr:hypothetical protein EXN66_Car003263 [Channa argus]